MSEENDTASFIKLNSYSGPLDLLLQLIQKQEMDILQIDIHKITSQYVSYLNQVPKPNLEMAGDFIRIASILLYIKSKTLLPKEEQEENQESSKLKDNLVQLLVNYQKFQKIGELLYQRSLLGRDCWKSPRALTLKNQKKSKIEIDKEKGLFQLIQCYHQSLLDRKAKENYKIHKSIPSILHRLKQTIEIFVVGSRLKFSQLTLIKKEKYSRLLSFLSILELSKYGFISLFQKKLFSNIEILVKKPITEKSLTEISYQEEKAISALTEETSP